MTPPDDFPQLSTGETLFLGLKGRCPRCGAGSVFTGYLKVADRCQVCGLGLAGHDTGDGPVVPAILILGGVIVFAALGLELISALPLWVHAVIWFPVAIVSTMAVLPPLKGISIAMQFRFRSTEEPPTPGGA